VPATRAEDEEAEEPTKQDDEEEDAPKKQDEDEEDAPKKQDEDEEEEVVAVDTDDEDLPDYGRIMFGDDEVEAAPAQQVGLVLHISRCFGNGAVRWVTVRCGAVRCGAVRCGAVRCGAVRCGGNGAVRWDGALAVRPLALRLWMRLATRHSTTRPAQPP
jgi:hypothetical protein